jgi:metal-sulfur cluster biosynthetic enzyme
VGTVTDAEWDTAVREALRAVIDPEVGMNIVDLGLVYGIDAHADHVHVKLTMTTPACPLGPAIVGDAETVLHALLPDAKVQIELVWEPPWTPALMSDHAKRRFGWDASDRPDAG